MKKISPNLKPKSYTFAYVIAGMIAGAIVVSMAYEFNMRYYLRSPFQNPIVPRELSPIPDKPTIIVAPTEKPAPKISPKPKTQTKAQIVASSKYPDFIDHIWERESTRGANTKGLAGYCIDKGLSNEMGFAVSVSHCFPTFEASVRRLERWYEENSGLSYNAKLCYYNSGVKTDSCAYLTYEFLKMN